MNETHPLKTLRLNNLLSQEDFAQAIGVTQGTVSHMETRRLHPNADLIEKMAPILGMMPSEMTEMLEREVKAYQSPRNYNVGHSDYSKRTIQPWDIWYEYELNPWDADIVKRVLRNKGERRLDYQKIKHICDERIRQIDEEEQHAGMARQTSTASQVEEPRQDSECSPER